MYRSYLRYWLMMVLSLCLDAMRLEVCISAERPSQASDEESEQSVARLLEAVWSPPPDKLDVLICRTLTRRGFTRDQLQRSVEEDLQRIESHNQESREKWAKDPEERRRLSEMMVTKMAGDQVKAHRSLARFRISGTAYRMDQLKNIQGECKREMAERFDLSFVNTGKVHDGIHENLYYDHTQKSAQRYLDKAGPKWFREDVLQIKTIGPLNVMLLQAATRRKDAHEPDTDKMTQLATGKHSELRISVDHEIGSNVTLDVFRVYSLRHPHPVTVIKTAASHPEIVVRVEQCDANTGKAVRIYQATGHDTEGIPKKWRVDGAQADGFMESDVWDVLEYSENAEFGEDVFAFTPPAGYEVVTVRPSGTNVRSSDGREQSFTSAPSTSLSTGKWLLICNLIAVALVIAWRCRKRIPV